MTFNSKWKNWTPESRSCDVHQSAKSANIPSSTQGNASFGTSVTSLRLLDEPDLDPSRLNSPDNPGPVPMRLVQEAILNGRVALVWSTSGRAWTYVVYDNARALEVRSRHPEAVVFTLKEVGLMTNAKPNAEHIRAIHKTKQILGAELKSIVALPLTGETS